MNYPPDDIPQDVHKHYEELAEKIELSQRQNIQCIGNRGDNGCGYVGGEKGDNCPKCGGMLLSERDIKIAEQVARDWRVGPDGIPVKEGDILTEEDGELVYIHSDGTKTYFV